MKRLSIAALVLVGVTAPAFGADVETGRTVFQHWCLPCHGEGPGHPGTAALDAKYNGAKAALLEQRTDLTVPFVKTMVRQGISVMAPFRKSEITDAELDALANYLRHPAAKSAKK